MNVRFKKYIVHFFLWGIVIACYLAIADKKYLFPDKLDELLKERKVQEAGTILESNGTVTQNNPLSLSWRELVKKQKVFFNDSIYSGPHSNAKIKVLDNSFEIGPNTLIVIEQQDKNNQIKIKLERGTIFGKFNSKIKLSHKPKDSQEEKEITPEINQNFIITSTEDGDLKEKIVPLDSIEIIHPQNNLQIYSTEAINVLFKYLRNGKENSPTSLQLSTHSSFNNILLDYNTDPKNGSLKVNLSQLNGKYFWRFYDKAEQKSSEVFVLNVLKLNEYKLASPTNGDIFYSADEFYRDLFVSWSPLINKGKLVIKNQITKKIITSQKIIDTDHLIIENSIPYGKYQLHIEDELGVHGRSHFEIISKDTFPYNRLQAPANGSTLFGDTDTRIIFSVGDIIPNGQIDIFKIKISETPDFSSFQEYKINAPTAVKLNKYGKYFWSLSASSSRTQRQFVTSPVFSFLFLPESLQTPIEINNKEFEVILPFQGGDDHE